MQKGYVEAFTRCGATLRNSQWSFSARAADGAIVVSCWYDFFLPSKVHGVEGVMRYRDTLERVKHNALGHDELKAFLEEAQAAETPFRLIVARAGNPQALTEGRSASSAKNRFDPRPGMIGSLVHFDGNEFVIDFRQRQ